MLKIRLFSRTKMGGREERYRTERLNCSQAERSHRGMTEVNMKDKSAFLGQESGRNEERRDWRQRNGNKYCIVDSREGREVWDKDFESRTPPELSRV